MSNVVLKLLQYVGWLKARWSVAVNLTMVAALCVTFQLPSHVACRPMTTQYLGSSKQVTKVHSTWPVLSARNGSCQAAMIIIKKGLIEAFLCKRMVIEKQR